jgi:hypothetical protein
MTEAPMGAIGTMEAIVWPTYAGAVNDRGDEPMFDIGYSRGQITWGLNDKGVIEGHTTIDVPPGTWTHIIYCRNAFSPGFVTAQKLSHPLVIHPPDDHIDLFGINEDDIKPFTPDPVLHD